MKKYILLLVAGCFFTHSSFSAEIINAKYISDFRALVCKDNTNAEQCEKGVNILMHLVNANAKNSVNCKILMDAGKKAPEACNNSIEVSDYISGLLD